MSKRPSATAQLAAAHRAYHLMRHRPPILEDDAAIWLLGPPLDTILRVAPLRWIFWERLLARVRPISVFVVVRSRYVEDWLDRSIAEGHRQYTILGAGLDSWALRHQPAGVQVYELDRPATQQWKAARVVDRLGQLPEHLTLIPIDFETQAIAEALHKSSFDPRSLSVVSWLGTIYYLTTEAIERTFASLATVCAPGSRIVFDYFEPKSKMSPEDLQLFEVVDRGGTRRGEPLKTLMDSVAMERMLNSTGFHVVEDLPAAEIRQRYLRQHAVGLDIPGFARVCCAERMRAS